MTDLDPNMPIGQAIQSESSYLKQSDVGPQGVNLKIVRFSKETMGDDNSLQTCIHFSDPNYKPMVIKPTNRDLLNYALGLTDDSPLNEFLGKAINVFADPTVTYAGKRTGGLRIRAAVVSDPVAEAVAKAQTTQQTEPNDDIPF